MALQYVAGSVGGDLLCAARTVRRARELIFTEITATDEAGKLLAHGLQTYRIARTRVGGQRSLMTFPVMSAAASEAR
jgi:acyl-coenzyme A thioesterase PaaI-like protein